MRISKDFIAQQERGIVIFLIGGVVSAIILAIQLFLTIDKGSWQSLSLAFIFEKLGLLGTWYGAPDAWYEIAVAAVLEKFPLALVPLLIGWVIKEWIEKL